ncbi:MAG: hypothetical protein ABH808_04090 [Candidatus Kuenenbacteria bacterium]
MNKKNMNKNFKKFNLFTIIFIMSVFFIFSHQAQAVGNTRGWAWSENIGWISFNCNNSIEGKPNGTCETVDYGVNIEESGENAGKFSGYAWSENIGWINFGPLSGYPVDPQEQAKLNISQTCGAEEKVTGWAQVENTNGWIKMSGKIKDSEIEYKVKRDGKTEYLTGWAWSEDFGWISFNCKNTESCDDTPYKVETFTSTYKPSVTFSSEPVFQDNCSNNGLNPQATLRWVFEGCNGDTQTGYEVQIATDSGFTEETIVVNEIKYESAEQYIVPGNKLEYGGITGEKNYFWRVKVQSNDILWSGWSIIKNFSTPKHPYPEAYLECSKDIGDPKIYVQCKNLIVSAGETVYFKGNDPEPCGGLSLPECSGLYIKERTWGFGSSCPCLSGEDCDGGVCKKTIFYSDSEIITTSRVYNSVGQLSNLSLEIIDTSDYMCSVENFFKNSKVDFTLPIWKEVIPKD